MGGGCPDAGEYSNQSQNNLKDVLGLQKKPQGSADKRMAEYAYELGEKIKALKASTTG